MALFMVSVARQIKGTEEIKNHLFTVKAVSFNSAMRKAEAVSLVIIEQDDTLLDKGSILLTRCEDSKFPLITVRNNNSLHGSLKFTTSNCEGVRKISRNSGFYF